MATFQKLPSGNWRVLIRRKKSYASETFRRRYVAEIWALDMERRVDRNESICVHRPKYIKTFANLVDLHISVMHEVQKQLRPLPRCWSSEKQASALLWEIALRFSENR